MKKEKGTMVKGFLFPSECPNECPEKKSALYMTQSGMCGRCPIMVCGGDDPMVPPIAYRRDWAEAWYQWFYDGMKGLPDLKI